MSENQKKSDLISGIIKVGRRGQITLPRVIRLAEGFGRGDRLKIVMQPTGSIYITKVSKEKDSFERLMKALEKVPRFDAEKAWKEVEKERRESER